MPTAKVLLVVLDGLGVSAEKRGNAFALANTPNINKFISQFPTVTVDTSGYAVGLPSGEVGNSEVGHLTLGTGQIINQNLPRINQSINDGTFYENKTLLKAAENCKKNKKALHLMGLYGTQGVVHSDPKHLTALLKFAKEQKLKQVYIHLFTDGRDSPPTDSIKGLNKLQKVIQDIGVGQVVSLCGRYYAMDRNANFDRTAQAYLNLVQPNQGYPFTNPIDFVNQCYQKGSSDEFMPPAHLVDDQNQAIGLIQPEDSVIFFNYRADRAVQITKAFVEDNFQGFQRQKLPLSFMTMIEYEAKLPVETIFDKQITYDCLTKLVSDKNIKTLKVAETEKYAHVTYFFNGGIKEKFANEERFLAPSRTQSFDKIPDMQAEDLTRKILDVIPKAQYHLVCLNYANPDMVGHTGNLQSAIKALEIIDYNLGHLVNLALDYGYITIITADHGNCEEMIDLKTGQPSTTHTSNPVFMTTVDPAQQIGNHVLAKEEILSVLANKQPDSFLIDVAPKILSILNIEKPEKMAGQEVKPDVAAMLSRKY